MLSDKFYFALLFLFSYYFLTKMNSHSWLKGISIRKCGFILCIFLTKQLIFWYIPLFILFAYIFYDMSSRWKFSRKLIEFFAQKRLPCSEPNYVFNYSAKKEKKKKRKKKRNQNCSSVKINSQKKKTFVDMKIKNICIPITSTIGLINFFEKARN